MGLRMRIKSAKLNAVGIAGIVVVQLPGLVLHYGGITCTAS